MALYEVLVEVIKTEAIYVNADSEAEAKDKAACQASGDDVIHVTVETAVLINTD